MQLTQKPRDGAYSQPASLVMRIRGARAFRRLHAYPSLRIKIEKFAAFADERPTGGHSSSTIMKARLFGGT
jgi:hypothetical protein